MAQFTQFGRPVSCASTTPAISITDVVDLDLSFDPELHEHFGGSNRFPRYTIGNDNTTIKLTTTDIAALGWVKGMEAATLVCTFEATSTLTANTGAVTKGSGTIGLTISNARVIESTRVKNGANGQPGEIEVTFRAAIVESSGVEPTLTIDFTMA